MRTNFIKWSAFAVALMSSVSAFALPAPKYLAIKDVQKCLSETTKDTATFVCVPSKKPTQCPSSSWKKLKSLKGEQKVPACPLAK